MAIDANINRIKFLRTTTSGNKPTTSLIQEGELALNFADRTIYSRSGNDIIELGFGKGGSVFGDINNDGYQTTSRTFKATGGGSIGDSQGGWLGWNKTSGQGRTDLINNKGTGAGGWDFWNGTTSANMALVASIDSNGNYSKNANTATTLQTARTITLSGDSNGSVSFNGGSNVTINTSIRSINDVTASEATLNSSWRTGVVGVPTNGPFTSVYRFGLDYTNYGTAYGSNFTWGNADTHAFINTNYNSPQAWLGGGNNNKINWVKQLAFLDSNVSSATKLQTSRLIWGQSFDGTGDVNGDFSSTGNIKLTGEDRMIAVGINQDIALVKKSGAGGKLAIGSGNSFTVTKSNKASINTSDTFTDMFSVNNNGSVYIINDLAYNKSGFNANLSINASGAYLQMKNASGTETAVLRGFNDGNGDQLNLKTGGANIVGTVTAGAIKSTGDVSVLSTLSLPNNTWSLNVGDDAVIGDRNIANHMCIKGSGNAGGIAFFNGNTQVASIQGSNYTGNSASATKFATARRLNGILFDGTSDITVNDAWLGHITTEDQANAALNPGCYVAAGWSPSGLNLYSYGMVKTYRQNDNPEPITQIFYAHQKNKWGSMATRQSWDAGQSWGGWRVIDDGFVASGFTDGLSNPPEWNAKSGYYKYIRNGYSEGVLHFTGDGSGSTSSIQIRANYDNSGLWYRTSVDSAGFKIDWDKIITEQSLPNYSFGRLKLDGNWNSLWSPNEKANISIGDDGKLAVWVPNERVSGGVGNTLVIDHLGNTTIAGNLRTNKNLNVDGTIIINGVGDQDNAFKKLISADTTTDGGYLAVGNNGNDKGYVELGTVDDAETYIYARQRNNNGIIRSATLLDPNGNTSFPGAVYSNSSLSLNFGIDSISGDGRGISLYEGVSGGNGSLPNYGIAFAKTSTFGKHGYLSGDDWATYFNLSGNVEQRGWIFRNTGSKGNVFSINSNGSVAARDGYFVPSFNDKNDFAGQQGFCVGNADNATYDNHNVVIRSWWGIGFHDYQDKCRIVFDTRNGTISTQGTVVAGYITTSGNVNAGNAVTAKNLSLSEDVSARNVVGSGTFKSNGIFQGSDNHYIDTGRNTVDRMNLATYSGKFNFIDTQTGNILLSINTETATFLPNLSVSGNITTSGSIYATGNITAYSDIRLKTDIEKIENSLDKVSNLNGVTYTRTDMDDKTTRHIGLIAQDVLEVCPEAVVRDENDLLSVNYQGLIGLLVESIKELNQEIQQLKKGK